MKIGKFSRLTFKEYHFYIDNHKSYTDFNVLGLYRSILENDKLSLAEKVEVREYAHQFFRKSFDFLQLKDPGTFFELTCLGLEMTVADEEQIWKSIKQNQKKILVDKRIRHRNFGKYSKHSCGYTDCPMNGVMTQKGSYLEYHPMQLDSDKNSYSAESKSKIRRQDRKREKAIIVKLLSLD